MDSPSGLLKCPYRHRPPCGSDRAGILFTYFPSHQSYAYSVPSISADSFPQLFNEYMTSPYGTVISIGPAAYGAIVLSSKGCDVSFQLSAADITYFQYSFVRSNCIICMGIIVVFRKAGGKETAVFPAFTLCSYFIQKPFTQSTLFLHVFPIYFNHRQLEIAATQKRLQDFFHNTRADKKLSALLPFNNTF